ncbi:MAG: four helix bundle protein [bacterium]|nr:four helix bundle protein [bacterium]
MVKFDFKNYRFENLEVWKLSMQIVHEVYKLVKKFPRDEIFSLIDQLKRAAISIVLNIAEGSGQLTAKGFAVYLHRSKSSALECVACIKIAIQENFIVEKDVELLNQLLQEEYFKIIALEKSIK